MMMKFSRLLTSLIAVFALTGSAWAQDKTNLTTAQGPLGVYAKVDIEDAIAGFPVTTPGPPSATVLHAYLRNLYAGLLADPAISGIAAGQRWDHIEASEGVEDWSYLDDIFAEANLVQKSVLLNITPGFDSPAWLLAEIPSCDGLFAVTNTASPDCGKVTFSGFPEEIRADGVVLPLPWNSIYQEAWKDFLTDLNARYQPNPAFVAMAVAGPVGASTEVILPTSANTSTPQLGGLPADALWAALIKNSFPDTTDYQNTDQAFIDSWDQTIDAYEQIFAGVTLFIGADDGSDLPEFSNKIKPHSDNTLYGQDCGADKHDLMSCEAKTEILSHFVTAAGPNGKSTQVGGMTASSTLTDGNIGVPGVKVLTSLTPPPSPAFQGGAEFDFAVSGSNAQLEGCPKYPKKCKNLSPEEGGYYVLKVFFNQTTAGKSYGGMNGSAPIQYLNVPYLDVQYAQANLCPATKSKIIGNTSLQDLLNMASHDIFGMAGQPTPLPPPTCTDKQVDLP
ncbi:MAG TPA: hypothetical protein VI756_14910 [Blastocatellia bacterium]